MCTFDKMYDVWWNLKWYDWVPLIDFIWFKHKKRSSNTINMTIVKKQKKRKEGTYIASLHASKKYKNPSFSAYKISSNSILKIKRETRGIFLWPIQYNLRCTWDHAFFTLSHITETQVYPTFHLNLKPCAGNFIIHIRSHIKIQYANAWNLLRIVIAISSFPLGSQSSFVRRLWAYYAIVRRCWSAAPDILKSRTFHVHSFTRWYSTQWHGKGTPAEISSGVWATGLTFILASRYIGPVETGYRLQVRCPWWNLVNPE